MLLKFLSLTIFNYLYWLWPSYTFHSWNFLKLFRWHSSSCLKKLIYIPYVKCDFPCLVFPGYLPSSVKYNQLPSAVASQSYKTHNNNFYRCNYRYNLTWPWSPSTLHKCYMVFLQNFFLSSVFAFFFGKTSQVMTYHLHQWDPIRYLSLESLKLIRQVSITCYFPTVTTISLAKTVYRVLVYAHPGPGLCWSSLPSTNVHYHHVMAPSNHRSSRLYL